MTVRPEPREVHVLNLGVGVQSTTLYLMIARGELPIRIDAAITADTQEEPGHERRRRGLPDTDPSRSFYAHLEWLQAQGGPPILVRTVGKLGDDLISGQNSTGHRFASIPAFTTTDDGASRGVTKRQCSADYKAVPIERTIRRELVGLPPRRAIPRHVTIHQYIGFSLDEAGRSKRLREVKAKRGWHYHFPLIERFWTRADCLNYLAKNVPHRVPRSACVCCPYRSDVEWLWLRQNDPEGWERAVEIDRALRTTGSVANRDIKQTMYLHRSCKPLDQVEFDPRPSARQLQTNLNFAVECEGVCGV